MTNTATEHTWKEGSWEQTGDRYDRVDKCFVCGCYRVATKEKLMDTTSRIRYYPPHWKGTDDSRYRKKPMCIEPVNYDKND